MTDEDNDDGSDLRFRVRLLIRHYSLPASHITEALGIQPSSYRSIGECGILPSGRKLEIPSKFTSWSIWEDHEGGRDFFTPGLEFLNRIVGANDAFIRRMTDDGGSVSFILDLPGDVNVGAVLDAAGVARLAQLKMRLSIEVFPTFPPGTRARARAASDG